MRLMKSFLIFRTVKTVLAICLVNLLLTNGALAQLPSMEFISENPDMSNPSQEFQTLMASRDSLDEPRQVVTTYPDEIKALARALRYDPQKMYEYVYDVVDSHHSYGLGKGGLGALIDESGNSFDQAHLLFMLLNLAEANGAEISNIKFEFGTLSIPGDSFTNWTGITSAKLACRLLGAGGVPASVNGSNECVSLSESIDTVSISHLWLKATLGGKVEIFDPTVKVNASLDGVLNGTQAATFYSKGAALSVASQGAGAGTEGDATWIENVNSDGMSALLDDFSRDLFLHIESDHLELDIIGLIGGLKREPYSWMDSNHTFSVLDAGAYNSVYSWSVIPDHFRTLIMVELTKGGIDELDIDYSLIKETFFLDEVYASRLDINPNSFNSADPYGSPKNIRGCGTWKSSKTYAFNAALRIDGESVPGTEITDNCWPNERIQFGLHLTLNAPNSKNSGEFLDDYFSTNIDLITRPVIFVTVGEVGDNYGYHYLRDLPVYDDAVPHGHEYDAGSEPDYPSNFGRERTSENVRYRLTSSWLLQSSRLRSLYDQLTGARTIEHGRLGVIYARTEVGIDTGLTAEVYVNDEITTVVTPETPPRNYSIGQEAITMSLKGVYGYASESTELDKRNSGVLTLANLFSTLEASVFQQLMGVPDSSSLATKFSWANDGPVGGDESETDPMGYFDFRGPFKFLHFLPDANENSVVWTRDDFTSEECISRVLNPGCKAAGGAPIDIGEYLANGYEVVAVKDVFLGPGMRSGRRKSIYVSTDDSQSVYSYARESTNSDGETETTYYAHDAVNISGSTFEIDDFEANITRGGAYIGVLRNENGEISNVAPIVSSFYRSAKGSGASSSPADLPSIQAPELDASVLSSSERSWGHTIDTQTGMLSYSPGSMIETGSAGFPQSLSYAPRLNLGDVHPEQALWSHNWEFNAAASSSGLEAMGEGRAINAVPTLVAILALRDLFEGAESSGNDQPLSAVSGALVSNWWNRHLSDNVVTITQLGQSQRFVRKPWAAAANEFVPEIGSLSTLTQNGKKYVGYPRNVTNKIGHPTIRSWHYNNVSYKIADINNVSQEFHYWEMFFPEEFEAGFSGRLIHGAPSIKHGFSPADLDDLGQVKVSRWSFPSGEYLDLTFGARDPGSCGGGHSFSNCTPVIKKVQNSYGRSLTFNYSDGDTEGLQTQGLNWYDIKSVIDENGRVANANTYTDGRYNLFAIDEKTAPYQRDTFTDVERDVMIRRYLTRVTLPNDTFNGDGNGSSQIYLYDEMDRLKRFEYPLPNSSGNTKQYTGVNYFVGAGRYSEVENAIGISTISRYDPQGRLIETISPDYTIPGPY